jgi:hypothetical protein
MEAGVDMLGRKGGRMHGMGWLPGAAALALTLALWGCEGSATQTTNGGAIEGVLVDGEGHPVPGAKVQVWDASGGLALGAHGTASPHETKTDARGHYRLGGIDSGAYNVFGEAAEGSASVLIPSVEVDYRPIDLGRSVLKAPGAIFGYTVTAEGPLESAFCYLPGSSYISISDEDGSCHLDGVPEGIYRVKYMASGYGTVTDTGVIVRSGEMTVLQPKLLGQEESIQPPTPDGLRAEYDSVTGAVNLAWNPVSAPDLESYILLAYPKGYKEDAHRREFAVKDAFFADTAARANFRLGNLWDTLAADTMIYQIRAQDSDGNVSRYYSGRLEVPMALPEIFKTPFLVSRQGDTAACGDTLALRLRHASPVPDPFEVGVTVESAPGDSGPWRAVYRETASLPAGPAAAAGPAQAADRVFTWHYGKTSPGEGIQAYPDRPAFNAQKHRFTFEFKTSAGRWEVQRIFFTADPGGCYHVGPARKIRFSDLAN